MDRLSWLRERRLLGLWKRRDGGRGSGGSGGGNRPGGRSRETSRIIRAEAVDDAAFLQVIRRHLESYAVARQNAHFVHAHATGKVTEQLVILRFLRGDANQKRCIGKALFDDANQFNHIFGHKSGRAGKRAVRLYRVPTTGARLLLAKITGTIQIVLQNMKNILL